MNSFDLIVVFVQASPYIKAYTFNDTVQDVDFKPIVFFYRLVFFFFEKEIKW